MFYSITGRVEKIDTLKVVLRVGSLSYEIITPKTFKLKVGNTTTFFTYLSIKNEQILLYGFFTEKEREIFLKISKSQGIGEKIALRILSVLSPDEIIQSIEKEDINTLSSIKGVGRKKAERLIFELKGKLPPLSKSTIEEKSPLSETLKKALIALGLKEDEAYSYIKKYLKKHGKIESIEDAIKEIIKEK